MEAWNITFLRLLKISALKTSCILTASPHRRLWLQSNWNYDLPTESNLQITHALVLKLDLYQNHFLQILLENMNLAFHLTIIHHHLWILIYLYFTQCFIKKKYFLCKESIHLIIFPYNCCTARSTLANNGNVQLDGILF